MMDSKGGKKLQALVDIERRMQSKWAAAKAFEVDAPSSSAELERRDKYLVTWPFPYMNGRLHLGHAFSLSKCEFSVSYRRLKGSRCLWPFGLHCTGMPIKACADKLRREMADFGYPPKFPVEGAEEEASEETQPSESLNKAKGKKSKLVAKTGSAKFQWQIMQSIGLADEEIVAFADPQHWLKYFPPLAKSDLTALGTKIDWRRSFITTDVNPYFDSFVRWQMCKLREMGRIKFGKRHCVFSPSSNQPCMDHDRQSGEGVAPQEYVLIKMRVLEPIPDALKAIASEKIFLVAATLRPETMYGQTNCWVHPDLDYIAYRVNGKEIFISTDRAANNLSYQFVTPEFGSYELVKEAGRDGQLRGSDLLGVKLSAPLTSYDSIYVLPMLTIKREKGTGIVTSVPSDAPDDYAALQDLKKKPALREKYGITEEMVMPYEPIPILQIPDFGPMAAVELCEKLGVKSQNDSALLATAKDRVYLRGFYDGVMTVGEQKGQRVQDAKKPIQQALIAASKAILYQEPESEVISRSGDECVVALVDQWFIDYADEESKRLARQALEQLETYGADTRNSFEYVIGWLHEWSCSRTYGLGSRLPWDEQYLVESLSDSTIYMAYYTIAHMLQGDVYGKTCGSLGVRPEQMNDDVWQYLFCGGELPTKDVNSTERPIPRAVLEAMRREFLYWHPFDLRVSGKDLIGNHLTFTLFNHPAIWPDDKAKWPRAILVNGHLQLNSTKMSKQTGNFLTLTESIKRFSADVTRLALADAGDGLEDANFVESTANAVILRLYTWLEWVRETLDAASVSGDDSPPPTNWNDRVFDASINRHIMNCDAALERMQFREALRCGFYEMQQSLSHYREMTSVGSCASPRLLRRFIEVQTLLLSPFCPHLCEYVWSELLRRDDASALMVRDARFPEVTAPVDDALLEADDYLRDAAHEFRLRLKAHMVSGTGKKAKIPAKPVEKPTHATIWVAKSYPKWQQAVLTTMLESLKPDENGKERLADNKAIAHALKAKPDLEARFMKRAMPFVQALRDKFEALGRRALTPTLAFDEQSVLQQNDAYLRSTLGDLERIDLRCAHECPDEAFVRDDTCPREPRIFFRTERSLDLQCVNSQPMSGLFSTTVSVFDGDSVGSLTRRLALKLGGGGRRVRLYRHAQSNGDLGTLAMRRVPAWNGTGTMALEGKVALGNEQILGFYQSRALSDTFEKTDAPGMSNGTAEHPGGERVDSWIGVDGAPIGEWLYYGVE